MLPKRQAAAWLPFFFIRPDTSLFDSFEESWSKFGKIDAPVFPDVPVTGL